MSLPAPFGQQPQYVRPLPSQILEAEVTILACSEAAARISNGTFSSFLEHYNTLLKANNIKPLNIPSEYLNNNTQINTGIKGRKHRVTLSSPPNPPPTTITMSPESHAVQMKTLKRSQTHPQHSLRNRLLSRRDNNSTPFVTHARIKPAKTISNRTWPIRKLKTTFALLHTLT